MGLSSSRYDRSGFRSTEERSKDGMFETDTSFNMEARYRNALAMDIDKALNASNKGTNSNSNSNANTNSKEKTNSKKKTNTKRRKTLSQYLGIVKESRDKKRKEKQEISIFQMLIRDESSR